MAVGGGRLWPGVGGGGRQRAHLQHVACESLPNVTATRVAVVVEDAEIDRGRDLIDVLVRVLAGRQRSTGRRGRLLSRRAAHDRRRPSTRFPAKIRRRRRFRSGGVTVSVVGCRCWGTRRRARLREQRVSAGRGSWQDEPPRRRGGLARCGARGRTRGRGGLLGVEVGHEGVGPRELLGVVLVEWLDRETAQHAGEHVDSLGVRWPGGSNGGPAGVTVVRRE